LSGSLDSLEQLWASVLHLSQYYRIYRNNIAKHKLADNITRNSPEEFPIISRVEGIYRSAKFPCAFWIIKPVLGFYFLILQMLLVGFEL
jgi:hypothetical protein